MLNLKHLFGGLPPAVVDHQLLVVTAGTVAYWLILGYYKGESRKVRNFLAGRTINANWSVFQLHLIPTQPPPTGNPPAYTYPVDCVCRAASLLPWSLELLVGCEEGDQCWVKKSKYLCSFTSCRRC